MTKRLKLLTAILIASAITVGCTRPVIGQEQPIASLQTLQGQSPIQPTPECEQAYEACFPLSGPAVIEPTPKPAPIVYASATSTTRWDPTPAKEYLYANAGDQASVLDRVISCESGWKYDIKNKTSTASGLAQFLNSTWINTRLRMGKPDPLLLLKHDWKEHIDTTIFLWDGGRGASHWSESRYCWQR